jgi:histidinol dehydrogenase
MNTFSYQDSDYSDRLAALLERTAFSADIDAGVAAIIADVRSDGDAAVARYAATFDGVDLDPAGFAVTAAEVDAAAAELSESDKDAIRMAHRQVSDFSSQRRPEAWSYSPRPGVELGETFNPLSRIAAYIPGGTAPLVSTVLHTITMAQVAGVEEIVVVTPPRADGSVNPAVLFAADLAGATEIYRLGGVYAVAALAYGTDTVRKVEKIVGPGNAYVTAAKRQVYGDCALDLVAGPSEVLVIADDSATAAFVAADILAQAEHGSGYEKAVLLSTSAELIEAVTEQLVQQTRQLGRSECVEKVLADGVALVHVQSVTDAVDISNRWAPEHLEIMTRDADATAAKITAAGAVFIGEWTPEPVGDFVAGPSHVLPTGGAARFFAGLTVDQFYRRTSRVKYTQEALEREKDAIVAFATMEQLDAHGRSASIRFE